jgi:nicotinamidase-related amidase
MTTKLDPERTALIVVDMQNDFADPDGALYAPPSGEVVEPILQLLEEAEDENVHTVYTQDLHTDEQFEDVNYYDEYQRWGEHVEEGTWGAQIVEELDSDRFADRIVQKHTYNAFHETELDGWLEAHGIDNVVICGTLANVCVLHTASGAGLRDYRPIVVEDCLGYLDESDKEYAVEHTDWLFGETVKKNELDWE